MKFICILFIPGILINLSTLVSTNQFVAYRADESYDIDGQANESFWDKAEWYQIDQVWLPYGTTVSTFDFKGRFKLAWTSEKLLMFVEVTDDILIDKYTDPLNRYWDDDCVEIFLDEDKSGGKHEKGNDAYNAFAYHVSLTGDVADFGVNDKKLFNDHVEVDLDTVSNNSYTWEFAISIYSDTYSENGTNSPVKLTREKEIGFSLAYCDNDESDSRENFIGAVSVTKDRQNDSYKDASIFGTLVLKEKRE